MNPGSRDFTGFSGFRTLLPLDHGKAFGQSLQRPVGPGAVKAAHAMLRRQLRGIILPAVSTNIIVK